MQATPDEASTGETTDRQVLRAPTIVFVEGADEERFVFHLLKVRRPDLRVFGMNVSAVLSLREASQLASGMLDVQIVDAGGQGGIDNLIALPVTPGFAEVQRIVVIWDAEEDPVTAFSDVRNVFSSYSLADATAVPAAPWVEATGSTRSVLVVIMPDGVASGSLESFLLRVLGQASVGHDDWSCIDDFITCVDSGREEKRPTTTAQAAKRRINAWLSIKKPWGLRLGAAFDPRYELIPLDHQVFDDLFRAIIPNDKEPA